MKTILVIVAMLALATTACGKKDGEGGGGGGECAALEVTVDGKAVALPNGFGVLDESGSYTMTMYNHADMTCENQLKGMRPVTDGEVSVRGFTGGKMGNGVGIEAWTEAGKPKVKLQTKPEKAGDPMAVCVSKKHTFTPEIGDYKGKEVTIVGSMAGQFCGERK
jgi:hypothetical protein